MEGLTKRKAKILARQCGSMLSGRPARERRSAKSTWSDTAARQNALREVERGIRASWTERAEQLSMDREVSLSFTPPHSQGHFAEMTPCVVKKTPSARMNTRYTLHYSKKLRGLDTEQLEVLQ